MAASSTARVYAHRDRNRRGLKSVQVEVPIDRADAVTAYADYFRAAWAEECREGKHGADLQAAWTAAEVQP